MMKVHQSGVLITGAPRIGKSKLALELLERGHQLISDDAVEISSDNTQVYAHHSLYTTGFLYVHQLGIFDVQKIFGPTALLTTQQIHIIIALMDPTMESADELTTKQNITQVNLSGNLSDQKLQGVTLNKLTLFVHPGSSIGLLIDKFVLQWQYNQATEVPAYHTLLEQHTKMLNRGQSC